MIDWHLDPDTEKAGAAVRTQLNHLAKTFICYASG